jgi:alanine racemase
MKTAPTWIEISISAFYHNIAHYKKVIGSGHLAAVIKSNAYGHDQIVIARLCEQHADVAMLCVANLSEAVALRMQGIKKPILVLNTIDMDISYAAHHSIAIMCYEKEVLDYAHSVGKSLNIPILVHVKVDTGMARFGLLPEECIPFIHYARTLTHVVIDGIFTHFAQSQHEDQHYTYEQHAIFQQLLATLTTYGIACTYRHAANSAAATTLEPRLCNFFRIGIGLYGIWSSAATQQRTLDRYPNFSLKPVLTWKAIIMALRTIPAGSSVGYDRTYTTTRTTTSALLPIGYYEGYDRRLSNNGMLVVHGRLVPIIGRVCMNVIIADVTDLPFVKKGDHATILGDMPGIHPWSMAQQTGSLNPREFIARLHGDIPRIMVP